MLINTELISKWETSFNSFFNSVSRNKISSPDKGNDGFHCVIYFVSAENIKWQFQTNCVASLDIMLTNLIPIVQNICLSMQRHIPA